MVLGAVGLCDVCARASWLGVLCSVLQTTAALAAAALWRAGTAAASADLADCFAQAHRRHEIHLSELRDAARAAEAGCRAELAAARQDATRADADLAALGEALARLSRGDFRTPMSESLLVDPIAARLDQTVALLAKTVQAFSASLGAMGYGAAAIRLSVGGFSEDLSKFADRAGAATAVLAQNASAGTEWAAPLAASAASAQQLQSEVRAQAAAIQGSGEIFQEIGATADRMAPILSLVNEVAFQTHFIALNAGVEAARLGDAGRGIAVVAQELRVLSQRAKDAAKQSNGLLSRVVAEAGRGARELAGLPPRLVALADRAGEIGDVARSAGLKAGDRKATTDAARHLAQFIAEANAGQARLVERVDAETAALDALIDKLRVLIDRFSLSGNAETSPAVAPHGARLSPSHAPEAMRRLRG